MIDNFRGEYEFLSNFYSSNVVFEGVSYRTSEAAFQAAKTIRATPELTATVREFKFSNVSPTKAKSLGRHMALREDWEEIKDPLLYNFPSSNAIAAAH